MAPLPVIANVARMTLNWTDTDGGIAANVLHFGLTGSETDLTTEVRSNLTDAMFKVISNSGAITSYDVIKLDGTSPTVHVVEAIPQTGGTVGTARIMQACAVVSLKTSLRGRSGRGRIFLPWVDESQYTDGRLDLSDASDMTDAWEAFVAAQNSASMPLVVASYLLEDARNVTALAVRQPCRTQRRRQSRVV